MKNTLIRRGAITSIALGTALVLSACGGGGGGGSTNNGGTSNITPLQGTYTGAAAQGDFATYTINGNTLVYSVSGYYFPSGTSGTLSLTPYPGMSGSNFWVSNNVGIFLSNNFGMAYIPSLSAVVVGLQNTGNISSLTTSSHSFVYVSIVPGSGVSLWEISINTDNSFTATEIDGTSSISGCWMSDSANNRIIAIKSTDIPSSILSCSNFSNTWNPSNLPQDYNLVATPTSGGTSGLVVDYTGANGNHPGVGIGLEQNAMNALNLTAQSSYTISALYHSPGAGVATESLTVSGCSPQGSYMICNYSGLFNNGSLFAGSVVANYDCARNYVPGMISATDAGGSCYDIFFDPTNNYYISVGTTTDSIAIGAIQQ